MKQLGEMTLSEMSEVHNWTPRQHRSPQERTTMSTVCATQYNLASSSDADLRPMFVEDHPYTLADLEETAEESGGGLVVIIRSVSPWQTHNNSN